MQSNRSSFIPPSYISFLLLLVALFAGSSVARAQLAGKGELKGTVTDPSGAVVPNATVTAIQTTTGQAISRTTNSSGLYDVSPLDPGIYTVTIEAEGFRKQTQNDVHVNALEIADYSAALTLGSSSETVTVTSAPPQLETSNATLGATMEQEMYSALPIEMGAYGSPDQRRATDFAFLMPGVQGNNTNGNPTTNTGVVNGSGSRGAVSDVYIDGLPFVRAGGNGDPRFVWTAISVDAVDQFQVQTSGYGAMYEGQGVQNYTIKQGGKNFHGAVYEFLRNTSLDTWGFFGKLPNPATGKPQKPVEHSNEYGINLSGPLVPFGSWREKVFFFGNYNGFRYSSQTPTQLTFPTLAQQTGNFQGVVGAATTANLTNPVGPGVYDPNSQTLCTANNLTLSGTPAGPCRYRYGYVFSGTKGTAGGATIGPGGTAAVDVIPASQFSAVALKMQSYLPKSGIGTALQNNYISPNATGLTNWSTTERIDLNLNSKDTISMVAAIGRQASSNPVGQTTAGRNVGPIPYNYGQTYAPKTAVGVIEETHIFTPNIVNQIKYGYARYNGPTFDADQLPQYSATTMGISNLPTGAAQGAFPITTFTGTNAPTNWGGAGPNNTLAANFTLLDNLQWVKGKHTLTFGGQIAWMQYNVVGATGGSTPLTLANAVTETAGLNNAFTAISNTGNSYASFLIGQIDKASFTTFLQQESAARFRPISPYVQDNWKVNSRLTLDLGLRYDFYPSVTETHDAMSYFDPNLTNPVTGAKGGLQFTGTGPNTCNCRTPVNNYYKNFGPRLGLAFQSDAKTVWRASYGVMFTHGGAVGGSNTSLGTLGFSGGLSTAANGSLLSTSPLTGNNGALPSFTPPTGAASGPAYGTGFTTTSGYTGNPQSMGYADPYLGGRAPEYINWSFGFQHQWTNTLTSTISYVGSEGHFLPVDSSNARGLWANQLDPKYLYLATHLSDSNAASSPTKSSVDCVTYNLPCPANFNSSSQSLATELKPFPFQSVGDTFAYVANSNYHALQTTFNMRATHGLTFMANYTWSRSIDDGGTFRSGYALPAGSIANSPNASYAADRIERSVSTSNQPHHIVVTGVWNVPLGREVFATHAWQRAVLGGFKLSEIFQAYSGSPLAITGSSCQTNPSQVTCEPTINPSFSGDPHINGHWGQGYLAGMTNPPSYLSPNLFVPIASLNTALAPAYTFGNAPRTAAFNLYGPGNYNLDLALVRSFPLKFTESAKFNFRAEMYNVTNHTKFAIASTSWGNSSFGQVTSDPTASRKAVQLSGRIEF